jgi:hypothetical protein
MHPGVVAVGFGSNYDPVVTAAWLRILQQSVRAGSCVSMSGRGCDGTAEETG